MLMTGYEKRGSLYPPPVPQIKAFALPTQSERATQKPTLICKHKKHIMPRRLNEYNLLAHNMPDMTYPQASTVALSLTELEVAKF